MWFNFRNLPTVVVYNLVPIRTSLPKNMTNTQQTFESAADQQDAFSLRKVQMLILWPLIVCLALAPLLFSNSEYYGYSKTLFWLSAAILVVLHIEVCAIIGSIETNSKQLPEIINKIDNEIAKKYIKFMQTYGLITDSGSWALIFAILLIFSKWEIGTVVTASVPWDIGITPNVKDLIADVQINFGLLLFIGVMVYLFELKREPYYWWTKKKRINNMVTMMLILFCVAANNRFDLVTDGKVPIELYFPKLEFVFYYCLAILALVSGLFLLKVLPISKMRYYAKLRDIIEKDKNKKKAYISTFQQSIFSFFLTGLFIFFDEELLAIGSGIWFAIIGVKLYSIANDESNLLEKCQSDLQIEYKKFLKKNKLFQKRKLALICISIARYVDNNFSLLLFSSLLYGVMLSTLIFL